MIKIGFVPLYSVRGPSSRYRVYQYLEPLKRLGYQVSVVEAPEKNFRKRLGYLPQLFSAAMKCNVLFVQKRIFPKWVLNALLRINPNLVYDLDDAIYLKPGNQPGIDRILKSAKIIIAGNQYLAEYARKYNQQATILPSVIDTSKYIPLSYSQNSAGHNVVLGWIGTDPNRGDLEPLKPVFDWMGERYANRVVLHTIGRRPLEITTSMQTLHTPWSLENSHRVLQQFDIGIMPLDDNEWNRGKCGLKLLQYMAVGIPTVASPVGVNQKITVDGETGMLASSDKDWKNALSRLVMDRALRGQMGRAGRQRVEEFYSVECMLPALEAIIIKAASESK